MRHVWYFIRANLWIECGVCGAHFYDDSLSDLSYDDIAESYGIPTDCNEEIARQVIET